MLYSGPHRQNLILKSMVNVACIGHLSDSSEELEIETSFSDQKSFCLCCFILYLPVCMFVCF